MHWRAWLTACRTARALTISACPAIIDYLHPGRHLLPVDALRALRGGDDQHGNAAITHEGQRHGHIAERCDDHIQGWLRLVQREAQLLVCLSEVREDVRRRPAMAGGIAQCPCSNDDGVGGGAQDAHHEMILPAIPADLAAALLARRYQRNDPVERGDEIADHVWSTRLDRQPHRPIPARKLRRQRQFLAGFPLEERLERR